VLKIATFAKPENVHFKIKNTFPNMELLKIEKETEFENIAQILFDNYAIQTHSALYRFIEIEFYWNSPSHIDNSTYKRKHVDPKAGDWFFHYSGVDIALKNEET
jgi:hypothetical protein